MINLIISVLITGFIGWFTNKLAILMLFHPKKPWLWVIQGLLIKRKKELASSLSDVIVDRLLNTGLESLLPESKIQEFTDKIADEIANTMAKDAQIYNVQEIAHIKKLVQDYVLSLIHNAGAPNNLEALESLKQTVVSNIVAIPDDEIKDVVTTIAHREFAGIEAIGFVLGCVIGLMNIWILT